jgi:hypothetical protein
MPRRPATNTPYTPVNHAARAAARAARKAERAAEHTALIAKIAQDHLRIETLETRNSDRLDCHDVCVESLRCALEAAYAAGLKAGGK